MAKKQRVTLKDIADDLNVSLGTVHRAIYNKKGVSEETRKVIMDEIEKRGYKINLAASALKRKTIKIAVALVNGEDEYRYFFKYIWDGVEKAKEELLNFNVEIIKYSFAMSYKEQELLLKDMLKSHGSSIDGLLTFASDENKLDEVIDAFCSRGIPVFTVNADAPNSKRIGCVSADTYKIGTLAGELMCDLCGSGAGQILMLGGERDLHNHQEAVKGFIKYIRGKNSNFNILELYDYNDQNRMAANLERYLTSFHDIVGIYCNNARGTLTMCKVLEKLKNNYKTIGSDVYPELIPYLKNKMLNAVIYQYPEEQAYKALMDLYNYITGNTIQKSDYKNRISIVMGSNAEQFV